MGLIGSIFQGIFGSNAANKAATVQADASNHAADLEKQAADEALAFNKQQYGNSLSLISPYYNMGTASLGRLGFLMGLNPAQGTPPGVVNPNAPQASTSTGGGGGGGNIQDIINSIRSGNGGGIGPRPMMANSAMLPAGQNPFQNNPTLPGAPSSSTSQFQMNPPITSPGTNGTQFQMNPPITSPGTNGTQFQMRPPITSGGTTAGPNGVMTGNPGAPGGATGIIQLGPDGQPIPGSGTPDFNPGPGGTLNLGPNAQNVDGGPTPATTNQGGTGQVPLSDGGIEEQLRQQGGLDLGGNGGGTNSGGFGSLAQNFGEQWKAPTGVTEVNDPGYQFRINQGLQALQNSAAARGKLVAGDTAKGLNDYAQNSASGEFQNVYNRSLNDYTTRYNAYNQDQNTQFNRFATLAGLGQTAAGQLSNVGLGTAGQNSSILLNSAGQIGQDVQNAGAARGSGYVGSANAINGAIGSGANNIAQLLAMMAA